VQRRNFIKVVGGSAVVWPFAARAQQTDQVRRIGALMQLGEGDPQSRVEVAAFLEGLQELGWSEGHNPRIDTGVYFLKHQQQSRRAGRTK
jgi:putative ABC transport system substrate-binding protein